jgi:hypothetical protein
VISWMPGLQAMIEPVESAPFNVMDRARAVEWKGIRLRFQRDADDVKLATRDLIDTCFRSLAWPTSGVVLGCLASVCSVLPDGWHLVQAGG